MEQEGQVIELEGWDVWQSANRQDQQLLPSKSQQYGQLLLASLVSLLLSVFSTFLALRLVMAQLATVITLDLLLAGLSSSHHLLNGLHSLGQLSHSCH